MTTSKRSTFHHAIAIAVFAAFPVKGITATPGTDTPDDRAYAKTPAWVGGENGGSGFKGWNLVGKGEPQSDRGFFIGNSSMINSDINTPEGVAFGMFAKGKGISAEAYRTFDSPLTVGQSFSVDLAVNFRSGLKGMDLRSPQSDGEKVIFNFNVGGDDYVVNKAATGSGSIGSNYDHRTAFKITFTQTTATGGSWEIERTGGVQGKVNGTYEGVAGGVKFYVSGTDGGKENDFWINNLTISGPAVP